jgi:hypothetical protein
MDFQHCVGGEKNCKIRVCVDFRNVNRTTSKDENHTHIVAMFINNAFGQRY